MLKNIVLLVFTTVFLSAQSIAAPSSLNYLIGKWTSTTSFYNEGDWEALQSTRAIADTHLGNSFIRMKVEIPFPGAAFQFEITFSYDKFNEEYRIVLWMI